jgi:hypothetical protein
VIIQKQIDLKINDLIEQIKTNDSVLDF